MDICTGVLCSSETTTPEVPTVGLCQGPYGGPRRRALSYERGTPVTVLGWYPQERLTRQSFTHMRQGSTFIGTCEVLWLFGSKTPVSNQESFRSHTVGYGGEIWPKIQATCLYLVRKTPPVSLRDCLL